MSSSRPTSTTTSGVGSKGGQSSKPKSDTPSSAAPVPSKCDPNIPTSSSDCLGSAIQLPHGEPQGHLARQDDPARYVRSLLDDMQSRFENMSQQILSKIDTFGSKVDALEAEISELMNEAGAEFEDEVLGKSEGKGKEVLSEKITLDSEA
ncbi:hsbp1-like protein [Nannochloropsis gaditana CCMP526]|uniref:hsbp1-like protein n=1 Tax=Nannochloropsis gaditana (strain CCMP526) TaxID=1093141 RepID=UPI00029F5875|nr:hsbp1-like protein [Nannochloropsis gaditana CCMP526]EKU22291.1 hsbp1-like protein [Nannochloropsis gaditana CCMP526]|eukprot:XP_005854070.1 hsbp1-like protein [Nannochloropsis gaditana CCMP526]